MRLIEKTALSAAVVLALSACGGSKDSNHAPKASNVVLPPGQTWLSQTGSFKATDPDGDRLKLRAIYEGGKAIEPVDGVYTLKNGLLTVQGFGFTFTPMTGEASNITYVITDGFLDGSGTIEIPAAATDPLLAQQWHLKNTGQRAYSLGPGYQEFLVKRAISQGVSPEDAAKQVAAKMADYEKVLVAGQDMNVASAYQQGATGKNMIAVVVDSGLEISHEDLQDNILPNRSLNLKPGVPDPTDPTNYAVGGDHGTSVGGLIAAVGWNGKGGRGVAPHAKLIGMNYLEAQSSLSLFLSHGVEGSGISTDEAVAVFNRSYGITFPTAYSYDPIINALAEHTATKLRSGKGAINTKSSGNSFISGRLELDSNFCAVNGAQKLGLSCYNPNFESSQTTPYYFSIGAVNSDGKHTSYSSAGANLLVVAPAGEYGHWAPAMVTTDQMTCLRGYSSFSAQERFDTSNGTGTFKLVYPFNNPGHPDNTQCNYTNTFNGTSSAAPNAAGVVSLILSANPNLTYRDVRHILASTSTKVDADNKPVRITLPDGNFVAHSGWVKNQAGFVHNNWYGFGRVDAGKAVQMAKNYTENLGELKMSSWQGVGVYAVAAKPLTTVVPDNSAAGAEIALEVTDDMVIEGAQFQFSVANSEMTYDIDSNNNAFKNYQTTAGSDLAIEVTSPQGTRSVLMTSKQALLLPARGSSFHQGYILKDSVMLSQAFYGERAKGTWKIRVLDTNGADINSTGGVLKVKGYKNNKALSIVEGVAIRTFGH